MTDKPIEVQSMNKEKVVYSWRQTDPGFNREESWSAGEFPETDSYYMRDSGWLVTSLACLLAHSGLEYDDNEELFNPLILCNRLKNISAFKENANLKLDKINQLDPLEYVGDIPWSFDKFVEMRRNGCYVILEVPGIKYAHQYIYAVESTETDMRIIDPASEKKFLSECDVPTCLVIFKKTV